MPTITQTFVQLIQQSAINNNVQQYVADNLALDLADGVYNIVFDDASCNIALDKVLYVSIKGENVSANCALVIYRSSDPDATFDEFVPIPEGTGTLNAGAVTVADFQIDGWGATRFAIKITPSGTGTIEKIIVVGKR